MPCTEKEYFGVLWRASFVVTTNDELCSAPFDVTNRAVRFMLPTVTDGLRRQSYDSDTLKASFPSFDNWSHRVATSS